jgi:hypothetical protein
LLGWLQYLSPFPNLIFLASQFNPAGERLSHIAKISP